MMVAAVLALGFALPAAAQAPAEAAQADAAVAAFPNFNGVVLVAKEGQPVFRKAYGQANVELGVANTPATKFRIGSVTKQFTAVSILQLQEAGKLSVNDPVSKYYPDAPESWKAITLQHLLTHTSGIPSYTGLPGFMANESRKERTPEQIIELSRDMPLQFEPGARYAYNNTGYVMLGLAIEKASGEKYADYVSKHIFQPLGMTSSGYDSSEAVIPGRAAGYESRPGGLVNASYLAMSLPYAAGSLYSTVDDLLIWDQALMAGKLLSPASYEAMYKDYGFGYGYGWQVGKQFDRERVAHGGGINGFSAAFARYPKDKMAVVVLSNVGGAPSGPIADRLAAVFLRIPPRTAAPGGEAAVRRMIDELQKGAPNYELMSGGLADVTRAQLPGLQRMMTDRGAVRTVTLNGADLDGRDRYLVTFERGTPVEYGIVMGANGVVNSAGVRQLPQPQPSEESRMAAFTANDRNTDGKLDKPEYLAVLQALGFADQIETLFPQRDANRDGFVSADEYRTPVQ